MPGTDVYMVSTNEGTLHCQTSAFLEARPGAKPNQIAQPMEWGEGDMCWTVGGDFGRVFGHPAFVAHGTLSDHTDDEDIRIVPWTGTGWDKICKVSLRFRKAFALAQSFCGDRDICRAAGQIAVNVAVAYNKMREQRDTDLDFRFGPPPAKGAFDAVQRLKARAGDMGTPEFPTFDTPRSSDPMTFSYEGFTYFPLSLNGKSYVGALGYDGVGWRQSGRTLFAIYSESQGALKSLAGFAIDLSNGGLISATVETALKN